MAFKAFHTTPWRRGVTLIGEPDYLPDDSLRTGFNVRLDRMLGAISSRPGWTQRTTAALGASITYVSRLVTNAGTFSYAQAGSVLSRLTSGWISPGTITTTNQVVSDANSPDGNGTVWKYFVNGTVAVKDNAVAPSPMGIAPATALGITTSLAADLTTVIDPMDNASSWTGTNLSAGPANDTTIFQEGTGSITFSVPANTFGVIDKMISVQIDTLAGGDPLVKQDDYIHLWLRCDLPQQLHYVQIDIDIDAGTASLANAFKKNYYHVRLGSSTDLGQGAHAWNQLQIRKSRFARFGTDTSRSWATVVAVRIGVLTTSVGTVVIYVDDLKLRGGVGLEGDISYTTTYKNSATGGRGNPVMDSNEIVQFTPPLRTNRQRITINTTNIRQGGANHPGDAQITHWMLWRKGGTFPDPVLVTEVLDTTASPTIDNFSDATLALAPKTLETDNDLPPTGGTRMLFGPGSGGHLFMIVDGYRLYFSKGYERLENRVENWGRNNFAIIGDGSAKAVTGVALGSRVVVWTTERTYNVLGVGQDTFIPLPVEGSHGCVSQWGATSGDNAMYFVSQDGIYGDISGRQFKLTSSIDPFFQGQTIDGQVGWNRNYTSLVALEFLNESTGSALVMIYPEGSSTIPNAFLVLKPNLENGQLTECFFGGSIRTHLQALFFDSLNRELLAGGLDGHVYRIENPEAYADHDTSITIRARTKSFDLGAPQHYKYITSVGAEGNTAGANIGLTAFYDRNGIREDLGQINTGSETGQTILQPALAEVGRRDISLELTGILTTRLAITKLFFMYEPQPELEHFVDSGIIAFDFIQQLKRWEIDIYLPTEAQITVYIAGIIIYQSLLPPTIGRQSFAYALPPGLRGRLWRITLTTEAEPMRCYRISGFFKQLGTDQAYTARVVFQGI